MLRGAIEKVETGRSIKLTAADDVPAAELVEAEYGIVRDTGDRIELCATSI